MTGLDPPPDPSTPFGECVRRRLRDDRLVWLTTVGTDGGPPPDPVWFLRDGETVPVYSFASAQRPRHVRERAPGLAAPRRRARGRRGNRRPRLDQP